MSTCQVKKIFFYFAVGENGGTKTAASTQLVRNVKDPMTHIVDGAQWKISKIWYLTLCQSGS